MSQSMGDHMMRAFLRHSNYKNSEIQSKLYSSPEKVLQQRTEADGKSLFDDNMKFEDCVQSLHQQIQALQDE